MADYCEMCDAEFVSWGYAHTHCELCDIFNEGYRAAKNNNRDMRDNLTPYGVTLWMNGYNDWLRQHPEVAKQRKREAAQSRVKRFADRWNKSGNAEIAIRM